MKLEVIEIGSLPRLNFVVQRKSQAGPDMETLGEFHGFCRRYNIDPAQPWEPYFPAPQSLMEREGKLTQDEVKQLDTFAGYLSITALAQAGIDPLYNGEQTRLEMSEAALQHIKGAEPVPGRVVSWGSSDGWPSYRRFAFVGMPVIDAPYHQDERAFVQKAAARLGKRVKVIETGAIPLCIWNSYPYHYHQAAERWGNTERAEQEARRALIRDLDLNVIIPLMRAHASSDVYRMTVDLSRVSQHRGDISTILGSIARMNDLIEHPFGLHFCFDPDYEALFSSREFATGRRIGDMQNIGVVYIETANRDDARGRNLQVYRDHVRTLRNNGFNGFIAPGFINVHTPIVENESLIAKRIIAAYEADPLRKIIVNPDCGLRTREWDVAMQKLQRMKVGADIAEREISG